VWATFACRALIPLGYMPASVEDGGPFILCPAGLQAELVQYLDSKRRPVQHDEHHHDADRHDQHQAESGCPIGASFASAIPVAPLILDTPLQPVAPLVERTDAPIVSTPETRYYSRAPPSNRSA